MKNLIRFLLLGGFATLPACQQQERQVTSGSSGGEAWHTDEFQERPIYNGLSVLIDKKTGCEYLWTNSGITPRQNITCKSSDTGTVRSAGD